MRLIDADALHVDYIFPTTTTGTTCYRYVSMQQINSAPTIDAVQERKGRWLRYGEDGYPNEKDTVAWQCDQCLTTYYGRTERIANYCPNCGAHMEGAEDDPEES